MADLGDPPTLSLNLPEGASVTTASGVFDSFVTATVPEPSTWAMMLLGFAGLGYAAYRRTRNAVSVGRIPTPLKRARPTGQITRYLNRTYRVLATRTGTRGRGALPAPARHANRPRTLRRDLKRLAVGPREVAEVDRAALEMRSTCKRTGVRIPPSPPRIWPKPLSGRKKALDFLPPDLDFVSLSFGFPPSWVWISFPCLGKFLRESSRRLARTYFIEVE